mgnify:CR=1 FL=1
MPTFWHIYIAAGTLLTIFFCGWLIAWSAKQGPQNKSDEETVGHVWDGDLEEWNNPLPRWWLYLFFITIFWGLGYLVAFPGLGGFKGLIGWSSTGQYEQEIAAARERYEPIYAEYAAMDQPVCELLHDLPRVRCPRRERFPQSRRRQLAVGLVRAADDRDDRQRPRGRHAGFDAGTRR